MKCEEALTRISAYIDNTLSGRELEEFIEHVEHCPECYDELETYYTIKVGINYLEQDRQDAYNIPQMLKRIWSGKGPAAPGKGDPQPGDGAGCHPGSGGYPVAGRLLGRSCASPDLLDRKRTAGRGKSFMGSAVNEERKPIYE